MAQAAPFAASDFFAWLEEWLAALPAVSMDNLVTEAGGPQGVGVFSADMINGFCHFGPLASKRIHAIIQPIVALFTRAYAAGVRDVVLLQDAHPADSPEFEAYGPHCIAGSPEAQTIPEFTALPFSGLLHVIPKTSLHPALGTEFDPWLDERGFPEVMIAVGNCTDLCLYQLAMHLRMRSHVARLKRAVVVPADCVQTYDVHVEKARQAGIAPHPGDLLHALFLYHLHLNNVRVVRTMT